jgi:hypothetical protein
MTEAEATLRARARHGARARRFVTADGTAQGDPALRVGAWLTLLGVNPMFVNVYAVTSATHRFDAADGYLTDFLAECAFLGAAHERPLRRAGRSSRPRLGEVTSVDDPQRLARVQVRLYGADAGRRRRNGRGSRCPSPGPTAGPS